MPAHGWGTSEAQSLGFSHFDGTGPGCPWSFSLGGNSKGTGWDSVLTDMREPRRKTAMLLMGGKKQKGSAGQNTAHTSQKHSCKAPRQGWFLIILFPSGWGKKGRTLQTCTQVQ